MSQGVLLDTCALIWLVADSTRLSSKQKLALSGATTRFVSAISCAELACLVERGRIEIDRHWKSWFDYYTELNGIQICDINYNIVTEAYSLPAPFHRDPCDRIITATARTLNLSLITDDRKLIDYPFVNTTI